MRRGSTANHLTALDGVRGAAAVVVVITHCFRAFDFRDPSLLSALGSPVAFFMNAVGAVQVFFVLSGFVLAASLARNRSLRETPQYFIRRIFRIHPPYVAAVLAAWSASFLYVVVPREGGASAMLHRLSQVQITVPELGRAALFPGVASYQLPPGWSLEVEMIFSFLLPLLLLLARRSHWLWVVGLSFVPLSVGPAGITNLKFGIDFALGIAVFQERERLAAWLRRMTPAWAALYLFLALLVLQAPWFLGWHPTPSGVPKAIGVMGLGAAALVAGAAFNPWIGGVFSTRPCLFVGKVSYSLYLIHYPVVILCSPFFVRPDASGIDALLMFALVLAICLALAAVGYRYVERPAIRVGNRLCAAFAAHIGGRVLASRLTTPTSIPASQSRKAR